MMERVGAAGLGNNLCRIFNLWVSIPGYSLQTLTRVIKQRQGCRLLYILLDRKKNLKIDKNPLKKVSVPLNSVSYF